MNFPRPIEAVVFDMDGLLIDSETLVRAGVMRAAEIMGQTLPAEIYSRTIGRSEEGYLAVIAEHFGPGFPLREFLDLEAREVDAALAAGIALKTGVVELLDHLDVAGLPYAVATSSRQESARRHLGHHGLYQRFAAVVAREDVTEHKPHPAPYLEAARRLRVAPEACLALEDSHNGVRAACAAGMMTVMVPDLLEATEEMQGLCVRIAADLHEVHRLVAAR